MTKILLIISLFFCVQSQAVKLKETLSRKVSPTSNLELGVFSLGFVNSTCTGTLISKKGHVLVARHCLESVIEFAGFASKGKYEFVKTHNHSKGLRSLEYDRHLIYDKIEFPFGFDSTILYGKTFAIGPGNLYPRFNSYTKNETDKMIHAELSNKGYSVGGDYAVIQVAALNNKQCYRLSTKKPEKDDTISSISFGCFELEGENEEPWPAERSGKILYYASDGYENDGLYPPKGNFISKMYAEDCNSGAAILSEDYEIVGLLHTVYGSGADRNKVFSVALSTHRMLELMEPEKKKELLELNKHCNKGR
jgi:hypothetical protein